MKATIEIDMGNAAFEDAAGSELASILRRLADWIDHDTAPIGMIELRDSNGNSVGQFWCK